MQRGLFRGINDRLAGTPPLRAPTLVSLNAGGPGRSRFDTIRVGTWPPNTPQANAPQAGTGVSVSPIPPHTSLAYPGELGAIVGVACKNYNLTNGVGPFSAVFHTAPMLTVSRDCTSVITSMETTAVIQNTGNTQTIPPMICYIATNLHYSQGGTATTSESTDYSASSLATGAAGASMVVTKKTGFVYTGSIGANASSPIQRAFWVQDNSVGTVTVNIGLDIDAMASGTTNHAVRARNPVVIYPENLIISTATPDPSFRVGNASTLTFSASGGIFPGVKIDPTIIFSGGAGGIISYLPFSSNATLVNAPGAANNLGNTFSGIVFNDGTTYKADTQTISATGTISFNAAPTFTIANGGTISSGSWVGLRTAPAVNTGATLASVTHISLIDSSGSGTVNTQIGLDIPAFAAGGTNIGIRNAATMFQSGRAVFGSTSTGSWAISLKKGNAADNALGIDVSTTGPTAPGSNAAGVISIYKGTTNYYLLVTFNDGGTTRYRYMQLNGTTATWTHGTTLPT